MIEIPVCKYSGSANPQGNATMEILSQMLTGDYLAERTAVGAKHRLPIACLGGRFRPLPSGVNHGNCNGYCGRFGYRNTEHINWDARTGLVLVDVDELADDDIPAVRERFASLDAVTALWLSAGRHGFKVGIAVDPIPVNETDGKDAWGTAALLSAALLTGIEHRIDGTHASAQAAILAHDPDALVRDGVKARLKWAVGDFRKARPNPPANEAYIAPDGYALALSKCGDVLAVANALNWGQGSRTSSLYRLGFEVGQRGWDLNLDTARAMAGQCGLLAEDGERCLEQYKNGYRNGRDTLCTFFPAMGKAAC